MSIKTDNSDRLNLKPSAKTYSRKKSLIIIKSDNNPHQAEIPVKSSVNSPKKLFFQNLPSDSFLEESQPDTGISSKKFKVNGTKPQRDKSPMKPKPKRSFISHVNKNLGKDWDEMEFLGGDSNQHSDNHSSDSLPTTTLKNKKYARTRKNLKQEIKRVKEPRKMAKKQSEDIHSTLPTFMDSNVIPQYPNKPSLMDMVRKFSTATSVSVDVPVKKKERKLLEKNLKFSKRKNSGKVSVSTNSSPESDRIDEPILDMLNSKNTSNSNIKQKKRLIKNSISSKVSSTDFKQPIALTPSLNLSPSVKNCNSKVIGKRNSLKDIPKKQTIENVNAATPLSSIRENSDCQMIDHQVPRHLRKRNCDVLGGKPKKSAKLENNNSTLNDFMPIIGDVKQVSESVENVQMNKDVTSMIEDNEKSSALFTTSSFYAAEDLAENNNFLNSNPQVIPQATTFENLSTQSNVVSSYIQPEMNNSLLYINSLVPNTIVQPFQNPVPTNNIIIVPIPCGNCKQVPNIAEAFNATNNNSVTPPVVRLSCTGAEVDNVLNRITSIFNQSIQPNIMNLCNINSQAEVLSNNVQSLTNISSENLAEIHNVFPPATDCEVVKNVETVCTTKTTKYQEIRTTEITVPTLSTETVESETEFEVASRSLTTNRNFSYMDYLCELMRKPKELILEKYRKNINMMNDFISGTNHLTVKQFYRYPDVRELLTNIYIQSSNIPLEYKLSENFEDSDLPDIIKSYISFHIKEIFNTLPEESLNVTLNLILEKGNSKLNMAEKHILKNALSTATNISMDDLICGLLYTGLIVIFYEFNKLQL